MDGWCKALVAVGLLSLVALGGAACGGHAADTEHADALTERIVRLEAWQMMQQKIARDQQAALLSQVELNRSFQTTLAAAVAHARSVDGSLAGQQKALALLSEVVQDLLAKRKSK